MRASLRKAAWRFAPGLMADRAVNWNRSVRDRHGLVEEARRHVREHGMAVSGGPFAGLRYPSGREADVDALVLKLTGAYEADLHPTLVEAADRRPAVFVDVGTADGYYAVGFARGTGIPTHGFEPSRRARALCAQLARTNGLQLTLYGAASSKKLRALPLDNAFVMSDCEGAEARIFDDAAVTALRSAFVVVELHERAAPGATELLAGRFDRTHQVELIRASSPEPLRNETGTWMVLRPFASQAGELSPVYDVARG